MGDAPNVFVEPDRADVLRLSASMDRVDAILSRRTVFRDDEPDIGRMMHITMFRPHMLTATAALSSLISEVGSLPDDASVEISAVAEMSLYCARSEAAAYLNSISHLQWMEKVFEMSNDRRRGSVASRLFDVACWIGMGITLTLCVQSVQKIVQ